MSARPRYTRTTPPRTGLMMMFVASLAVLGSALFGAVASWGAGRLSSQGFPISLALVVPVAAVFVLLVGFLNYDWLVLLTFSIVGFVRFEPAPFDLLIFVLLGIGLLNGRLRWRSSKYDSVVLIGLWAFIAVNITSAVGVVPIFHSLRFLAITLYMLVLFVFIRMYVVDARAMRYILVGYTVSALVTAVLVVLAFFGLSFPIPVLAFGIRSVGFFKDPNVYGPFGIVATLWIADQLIRGKWSFIRTALLMAMMTALAAAAVLSLSRAAWFNLALASALYVVLMLRGTGWAHFSRFLALGVAALVVGVLVFQFLGLGEAVASRSGYHAYDEQRFDTQWRGLLAGLSHPFGVGPGGWPTTHSLYAKTLAEHGVFGVTALALLIGALVIPLARRALREPAANSVLPAALLTALIVGQLANSFVIDSIHWRHFWMLLGMAWAILAFQGDERT